MRDDYDFSGGVVGKYAGHVAPDIRVTDAHEKPFLTKWRNASVRLLAGESDPIEVIRSKARKLVLEAVDSGRMTLPIDPFKLAESQGIKVIARPDIIDAQTVSGPNRRPVIEYNPARPNARIRFSICHELGHTLFPDCLEQVRHRSLHVQHSSSDNELEMLCNIAAAELLLPIGMVQEDVQEQPFTIDSILELRRKYEASTEAVLLRLLGLVNFECAAFAAVPEGAADLKRTRYRIEYVRSARGWKTGFRRGDMLPLETVLAQCTAIGSTAKGEESWRPHLERLRVEAVGTPPYPGALVLPRVVGIVMPASSAALISRQPFETLRGDALQPRGHGPKIVAHVVNDATANWGAGFGKAVQAKWPEAQQHFKAKFEHTRGKRLGITALTTVEPDVQVFQMVCQKGYGPSPGTRLKYEALRSCLGKLREVALRSRATVHMPKIGTGQAGGSWELVSNLISEELCSEGVSVTVYEPANARRNGPAQPNLFD